MSHESILEQVLWNIDVLSIVINMPFLLDTEYYRVTLNITSEPCSRELTDRRSAEFSDLQRRLSDAVISIIGDLPGRQVINIIGVT